MIHKVFSDDDTDMSVYVNAENKLFIKLEHREHRSVESVLLDKDDVVQLIKELKSLSLEITNG